MLMRVDKSHARAGIYRNSNPAQPSNCGQFKIWGMCRCTFLKINSLTLWQPPKGACSGSTMLMKAIKSNPFTYAGHGAEKSTIDACAIRASVKLSSNIIALSLSFYTRSHSLSHLCHGLSECCWLQRWNARPVNTSTAKTTQECFARDTAPNDGEFLCIFFIWGGDFTRRPKDSPHPLKLETFFRLACTQFYGEFVATRSEAT